MGTPPGNWNIGKRATPCGGDFGSKKPRKPCVVCKGDHHPGSCSSKLRPAGTACLGCGKPGHKSVECPDMAGGTANAIVAATINRLLTMSSQTCYKCHRGDHPEAEINRSWINCDQVSFWLKKHRKITCQNHHIALSANATFRLTLPRTRVGAQNVS